jgi:hypothetical protein
MSNMDIINKIKLFNKDEEIHILRLIFNQPDINYSENKNGTFFNMNDINQDTLTEVINYIHYVDQKENDINKIESEMDSYRYNNLNKF